MLHSQSIESYCVCPSSAAGSDVRCHTCSREKCCGIILFKYISSLQPPSVIMQIVKHKFHSLVPHIFSSRLLNLGKF